MKFPRSPSSHRRDQRSSATPKLPPPSRRSPDGAVGPALTPTRAGSKDPLGRKKRAGAGALVTRVSERRGIKISTRSAPKNMKRVEGLASIGSGRAAVRAGSGSIPRAKGGGAADLGPEKGGGVPPRGKLLRPGGGFRGERPRPPRRQSSRIGRGSRTAAGLTTSAVLALAAGPHRPADSRPSAIRTMGPPPSPPPPRRQRRRGEV